MDFLCEQNWVRSIRRIIDQLRSQNKFSLREDCSVINFFAFLPCKKIFWERGCTMTILDDERRKGEERTIKE